MNVEEAFAICEAVVRRSDPDRYFATLFAPAGKRPFLFVLYAFNHEIARATEVAREPMMAKIRLQWWRDAVEEAGKGRPRAEPVTIGLAEVLKASRISAGALETLIDARAAEIDSAPFPDLAAMEAHANATSGSLMRIAASLLDADADIGEFALEAGIAYGLAGIIRAIPFHAARGKIYLPVDLLAAEQLNPGDAMSARHEPAVKQVISRLSDRARAHFKRAQRLPIPQPVLPAVLPASLVPAYLSCATRPSREPMRERSDISLFRRQLIILRAAAFGRL